MYKYDEYDRRIVDERAEQFRGQVERRISGEITEVEFKPLRLQNGLYMQLHAYMLRVAIPYGLLSLEAGPHARAHRAQVRPRLRPLHDAPEHPVQLAQARGRARRSSTSWRASRCTRSRPAATASATSPSDHFAGVARDELEDPRPYRRDHAPVVDVPPRVRVRCRASSRSRSPARPATTAPRCASTTSACASSKNAEGERRLRGARRRRPGPHAGDRRR